MTLTGSTNLADDEVLAPSVKFLEISRQKWPYRVEAQENADCFHLSSFKKQYSISATLCSESENRGPLAYTHLLTSQENDECPPAATRAKASRTMATAAIDISS
jgi:hypothetical protein